jgi:hypothetical protein
MLRRALYANNFIFVEEYAVFFVALLVAAMIGLAAAMVLLVVALLLVSPRFQWPWGAAVPLCEDPGTTRPNTGSFTMCDRGFVDSMDRLVFLRGVNISGKLPLGHTTWDQPQRKGSFVGSLFDLNSIDAHLRRLASCGYTLLRLNVTWEAIEPIAEGCYDTSYIAYLVSVVRACDRYGMLVVIDAHQDVWSRWTGGDGAPRWTMERLGMDPDVFSHTRSALLNKGGMGHMTWFTNYTLYGAGTMFALFFGGNRFAPATRVNGISVQEWLQSAYIRAWCKVAEALAGEHNVLGFEPMNEPNKGWIGLVDLDQLPLPGFIGWALTPWDSIRLASGASLDVAYFPHINTYLETKTANTGGHKVWRSADVWRENGVWSPEKGLIRRNHFQLEEGGSFETDFLAPFYRRFAESILGYNQRWWVACHPKPQGLPNAIDSPHWYDGITLIMNRYIPFLVLSDNQNFIYPGYAPIAHERALQNLTPEGKGPFFLGEVGIPWLKGGVGSTCRALESTMAAVDARFISATAIWNYNPYHSTEKGDGWNMEDFSIWNQSLSFRMPTAVRPYAMVLAGKPVSAQWKPFSKAKRFVLEFDATSTASNVSLIFVPQMHYPSGLKIWTSDNGNVFHDKRQQTVEYTHTRERGERRKRIIITASV